MNNFTTFSKKKISYQTDNLVIGKNDRLSLLDNIRRAVGKGSLVGVLFLDLRQAFDTVSHATLGNVRVVQKLFVS